MSLLFVFLSVSGLLLLDVSVFAKPFFLWPRDRRGRLPFLGQMSHRGSEARFPGLTGCSCTYTLRRSKPNKLLCVDFISEITGDHGKRAQRSQFSFSLFEKQNFRHIRSSATVQSCAHSHFLPDNRK